MTKQKEPLLWRSACHDIIICTILQEQLYGHSDNVLENRDLLISPSAFPNLPVHLARGISFPTHSHLDLETKCSIGSADARP